MVRLSGRLAVYVGSLFVLTAIYAVVYQWGMSTLEGESRTWYEAFEVVVQSMTTTGYGQDAPWESPELTVLMIVIQVTGIAYIFVAFPLFVVPWLETLVQPTPPERADDLEEHVVIVGYTDLCASLVDELDAIGTPYVVLVDDEERAQELHEEGLAVVYGDPASQETLEAAAVDRSIAVVVDATEREFVSTILTVKRRELDAPVLTLIADPTRARYLRYAGADEVLSPRHRLGKAIGDKVRDVLTLAFEEGEVELGEDLVVVEYPIDDDSAFVDDSLAATRELEGTGATVLGAWVRGDFLTDLPSDVHTDENTTLVVTGSETELEAVAERVGSGGHRYHPHPDPVIVAGAGTVGATTVGSLERADLETVLVASEDGDFVDLDVDVVGDATTEEILREAGIDEARTIVVALEDDEDAILTTLVAKELNPDIDVLVAAEHEVSVSRLRDAGADYVLALPNVAGRMIVLSVFENEVMTLGDRLQLVRTDAPALTGERLRQAEIRDRTGCTVVALERNGTLETDFEGRTFEEHDHLVVAGVEGEIETFREVYVDG